MRNNIFLSYCLKIKELDDEEAECIAMREPLYRVETGNYDYRLILRCRLVILFYSCFLLCSFDYLIFLEQYFYEEF